MPTWSELRAEFESLAAGMRLCRIDYQWGAAGNYYRIAGGPTSHATRQFEMFVNMAGEKLTELPEGTISGEILEIPNHANRWYELLRYNSGTFEYGFAGQQTDDEGHDLGSIFTGTVNQPAEVSALLCIQFAALPSEPVLPESRVAKIEQWLQVEARERGRLWLVGGFTVMAIIAALAI